MTRRARRVATPLVAGALIAASLPPLGWWPAALLGEALLVTALRGGLSSRALTGLGAGLAQFSLGLLFALEFTAAGYLALVLAEALFVVAAAALTPPGRGRFVGFVGAATLAEWARDHWPFGGLPIGGAALGQVGGPLLGLARLAGPSGLVFAVALGGAALAAIATGGRRAAPVALAGLVAVTALAGLAPNGGAALASVRVAAVQGGGRRGTSALEVPAASVLAAELAATATIRRPVDLVIWPEDAVTFARPVSQSPLRDELARVASHLHATLLVGVTVLAPHMRFKNEAFVFDPRGRVVASYEKVHAVPFGEYVPLRALLRHVANLAAVPRDAIPGHASGRVSTPVGPLAVLLSFETFFDARGRSGVRAGGELVVVPTNTASYATDQIPLEEVAASRLEAVSLGRDVVQVATAGSTVVIGADGDVRRSLQLGERGVLRASVALRRGATPYDRFGSFPALVLAIACLAIGWLAEGRLSRRALPPRARPRPASRRAPC